MRFVEFSPFSKGVDCECKFYSQKLEMTNIFKVSQKPFASHKFVIMTCHTERSEVSIKIQSVP